MYKAGVFLTPPDKQPLHRTLLQMYIRLTINDLSLFTRKFFI